MEPDREGSAVEPARAAADALRAEITRLRVARRRQARVIAMLSEAVSNFHRGIKALHEENAELRARLSTLSRSGSRSDDELVEVAIESGPDAPAIARRAVTGTLSERVAAQVLANTQLLMSELVTNSVRHSGVPAGDELIVRLRVWNDSCRVEVEDPGHDGVIAPRESDPMAGSGMGLTLVQSLSERWGLVRAADGPTRVWAQVRCEAASGERRAAGAA